MSKPSVILFHCIPSHITFLFFISCRRTPYHTESPLTSFSSFFLCLFSPVCPPSSLSTLVTVTLVPSTLQSSQFTFSRQFILFLTFQVTETVICHIYLTLTDERHTFLHSCTYVTDIWESSSYNRFYPFSVYFSLRHPLISLSSLSKSSFLTTISS